MGTAAGQIRQLNPLRGDTVGAALATNDFGQVAGMSGTCANTVIPPFSASAHAVLWDAGIPVDLGNLGGTANLSQLAIGNAATAINDKGEVVGVSAISDTQGRAFLWTRKTGIVNLGALPGDTMSAALAINNEGEIVGNSLTLPPGQGGTPRPFLWKGGVMTDLNTLVPASSPLHLLTTGGINDRGQIVGFGVTDSGEIQAYLATPAGSGETP